MRGKLAAFFDYWSKGLLILILIGFFGGIFFTFVLLIAQTSTALVDLANRTLYSPTEAARFQVEYLQSAKEILTLALLVIFGPAFFFKLLSAIAAHVLSNLPVSYSEERQSRTESVNSPES